MYIGQNLDNTYEVTCAILVWTVPIIYQATENALFWKKAHENSAGWPILIITGLIDHLALLGSHY